MKAIGGRRDVRGPDRQGALVISHAEPGPDDFWKEFVDRLVVDLATTAAGLSTSETRSRLLTFRRNDAATDKRSSLSLRFLGLPPLPIGNWFEIVTRPSTIFAYVIPVTITYLALVEVTKVLFYRLAVRHR